MTSIDNPDYWSILGISPSSTTDQLKAAFRKEARRWHPDLNGNDAEAEERFKLVNEAYAVLSDPRKRKAWEELVNSSRSKEDPFRYGFPDFDNYLEVVLGLENRSNTAINDEIKDELQWPLTSPSSVTSQPPVQIFEDQETLVDLTPDEALHGTTVELELSNGSLVEIQTPQLSGDGWRLRLSGVARGYKDHFIQLRVQTEEGLRIDGLRVFYRLELFPPEAVLGCAVDVPTLSGRVTLQVPPLSSSGRLLRLKGRGLELDGRRGDQLVEIVIVIQENLGDAEDALYRRLQEIGLEE